MKKRILALLLALSMMLSLLPVSALADTGGGIDFAAYANSGLIGEMPDLRMNSYGKPDLSKATQISEGVYQGDGWKYEIENISDTLTLESGQYDFNYTSPRYRTGDHLNCVNVVNIVVQQDATIVGGVFEEISLLNNGTVTNGLFRGADVKNNGTLNCLFKSKPFGIECHSLTTADNSTVEVLLYSFGNTTTTYRGGTFYFTGTPTLTVKVDNNPIQYINGEEHYGGLKPSEDVSGYYTFTPKAGEDVVLNLQHYDTDLEMTPRGFPVTTGREPIYQDDDSSKPIIGYKGDGWKYENGTLTLESGEYDFSYPYPKSSTGTRHSNHVRCNVIVNEGAAITGGILNGNSLTNSGTVKDVLIAGGWITNNGTLSCLLSTLTSGNSFTRHTVKDVNGEYFFFRANYLSSGSTDQLYFTGTPTLKVKLSSNKEITYINGRTDYGGLSDPDEDEEGYQTFTPKAGEDVVLNDTIIHEPFTMTNGYPTASNGGKTACKGEGWEYILGNPEHGDFLFLSNAQIDFSKISDGSPVECKLFIGHGVAVQGGTFNGKVINNGGGILGGTFNGIVENHGTIENGVFNGAVTNIAPGTVSDSITGTGTLNGKPITPNAYTLTVTGGGLVNDKTSAVVEAGDEVCLTVGEMQEGMSFNYWDLPTALTKALMAEDSTFSNKVENLTFIMPDLSEYTEDKSFTIRLDIRPAELPDDDDGPSVLGTMATVAVGGAAAGILVWQGVSLGVDSYLQLSLPDGVPVPANRIELVKLLWETAGKPDVVLPALYGDVSAEDGELQKATRWAIDNGLVKSADESDASRFDPDRSVSKYEVARAWFKVQQMLK